MSAGDGLAAPAKRLRTGGDAGVGGHGAAGGEVLSRLGRLLLSTAEVQKLAEITELCDDALAFAAATGIVMYKVPAAKAEASVVPITLLPCPVDASMYREAVSMAPLFHKLMDRIACEPTWLRDALRETAPLDDICRGLLDICARVYGGPTGRDYSRDVRLHIMRNDFMLDSEAARRGEFAMRQIELNMIAASFSTHAQDLTEVHRLLLAKYGHRVEGALSPEAVRAELEAALPPSRAAAGIAGALAAAHRAYEARQPCPAAGPARAGAAPPRPRCVLVVAEVDENNELDHRKLESALFNDHGIIALRRSLSQLCKAGLAAATAGAGGSPPVGSRPLIVDGHEVTVAYFRSGYWPGHYTPPAECWAVREAIEASDAAKCPSALAQLAGMKKVQQLLSVRETLRRFLPEAGEAELLERSFARLADPSGGVDGAPGDRAAVEAALAAPGSWVLKPQVEGSGELIFDDDIPRVLRSKSAKELAEFVLMERVRPPVTPSVVAVREAGIGSQSRAVVRNSVGELGIFGVFVADGGRELANEAVGHLLRSKAHSTNQGGVFVGNAVVDAPLLLPSDVFWSSVHAS